MTCLEVTLAGAVAFRRGDRWAGDRAFRGRQVRLVTAMLVLERAHPVSVETLAAGLWPASAPDQWRVGIRNVVGRVRRALVDVGLGPEAIRGEPGRYVVDLGDVRVDLEVAADRLAQARGLLDDGDHGAARDAANAARTVLSRPVLAGIDAPWLDGVRERVAGQHLDVLLVLATCRSHLGKPHEARSVATEALALDPLREDAWRTLMRVEAAAGNVAGALRAYEACRARLVDELGVDPSAATVDLHARLLRGQPDPETAPPAGDVVEGPAGAGGPRPGRTADDRPPYVGLRAFGREDADRFFGRDGEVSHLVERLARNRIVVVVGPSGVGKSSLVRAGLLPALVRGALPDADTWPFVVVVPGADPHKSLAAALSGLLPDASSEGGGPVAALLAERGVHATVEHVLDGREPSTRLLVVLDQFEEVFTLGDRAQAERLVEDLADAATRLDGRTLVVVTLRADFYDRAAELPAMADLLTRCQFVVAPLDGEQVEAVVAGPAQVAGLRLEDGLLARILTDVAGEPGALPLLQHLLLELWRRRTDAVMTRGAYDDLGGVPGALAQRAEHVYEAFDADERRLARRVLLRGVQPGDDTGDARRPILRAELAGPEHDRERLDRVVSRLVAARLLTAGHDPVSGDAVLELAHEALIDGWPRLRAWVDEGRALLLDQRRLTAAARAWEDHARHDDWLLSGLPLDDAQGVVLAESRGDADLHLSPVERAYVRESLAAREHDRRVEAERHEREVRLQRRGSRWLRALVGLAVLVAMAAGVMWWDARRQAVLAGVRELVAASGEQRGQDSQRALRLALVARDRLGDETGELALEVEDALHAALGADRIVARTAGAGRFLAGPGGDLLAVARDQRTEDGWVVDLLGDDGRVRRTLRGHEGDGPVWSASFSPDGTILATGSRDGAFHLWDPASGRRLGRIDGPAPIANMASFTPDGELVATSFGEGEFSGVVSVRDVASGEVVRDLGPVTGPDESDVPALTASFSPDGSRLAVLHVGFTGGTVAVVRVLDTERWREVARAEVMGTVAAWSPDGSRLAVSERDNGTVVLDPSSGEVVLDLRRSGLPGGTLAWHPDGARLAVGGATTRVWDVERADADPIVLTGPAAVDQANVAFLPDDRLVSGVGDVVTWDIRPGPREEVARVAADGWQPGVDWAPSGEELAVSIGGGELSIVDTTSWEERLRIPAHESVPLGDGLEADWVLEVDWHPSGERVATAGSDDTAVWDVETGQRVLGIDTGVGSGEDVVPWHAVAWSPDGGHLAATARGGAEVVVVDDTGRVLATRGLAEGVNTSGIAFSPDGRVVAVAVTASTGASGSQDAAVELWEWQDDRVVMRLDEETYDLAWNQAGLVTSGGTRAEVWDVEAGEAVAELAAHDDWVQDATWSPDGDRVVSCGGDGTVRVSDADDGRELMVLTDAIDGFCQVRVSPDGRRVAVTEGGPVAALVVFTHDLDELADLARSRILWPWTAAECREYLHTDDCPT